MNDLALTLAAPEDLATILSLVRAYFDFDGLVYSAHVEAAVLELLREPACGRLYLAESGGETLGYAALTFGFDHETGGRIGVLTDLYLVESARGRGLGAEMLDAVLAFALAEGLRKVELWVLEGNLRAETLYRSRGFEPVQGRRAMSRSLEV